MRRTPMLQLGLILLALAAAVVLILTILRPALRLHGSVQLLSYVSALYLIWFGWYVYVLYVESANVI